MYLPRKGEIFTFPKNLCQLQLWHFVWYNTEHPVLRRSEIRWLRYSLLGISLPYLSKQINPEHTFYIICVFRIFTKKRILCSFTITSKCGIFEKSNKSKISILEVIKCKTLQSPKHYHG